MEKYLDKVTIEYRTCRDCPHLSHTGMLSSKVHYVCDKAGCRKICRMNTGPYATETTIKIPSWCPLATGQS